MKKYLVNGLINIREAAPPILNRAHYSNCTVFGRNITHVCTEMCPAYRQISHIKLREKASVCTNAAQQVVLDHRW